MARFGRSFPVPRERVKRPRVHIYHSHGTFTGTFAGIANGQLTYAAEGNFLGSFFGTANATITPPVVVPGPTLHGMSAAFLQAVATDQRWASRVEVRTAGGVLIDDITQYVTGGSVSVDETAEIRRTCSVTLQGTPNLVPESAPVFGSPLVSMLHPATGNELWIWRGVEYADGVTELAQLGVFRMTTPNITDDGATVTITIAGSDRASVVSRIQWQQPYTINSGNNMAGAIATALQFIIGDIYPNMDYSGFVNNTFAYPDTVFGATPSSGGDPMSDLITFAAAAGCELFFNIDGNPIFRSIINPVTSDVVDAIHFVEGDNCTMDSMQRTLDESTAYNGVIVYANGASGTCAPFTAAAWDVNPNSGTYYKGPWGQTQLDIVTTTIPAPGDTFAAAYDKAYTMAVQQLQLVLGAFDDVSLTTVPNPALQEGDCVRVVRGRLNIDANYILSSMTIPLDPLTDMTITFRPQVYAGETS